MGITKSLNLLWGRISSGRGFSVGLEGGFC